MYEKTIDFIKELYGMVVSSLGTPIDDDISCCDKAVSLSEDAMLK